MQWLARRLQIFGVHVHVGVRSPDKAMPIVNALTAYVPHLPGAVGVVAVLAGTDTGLASSRSKVFEGLPTAGLPYQLTDWEEFEQLMATLVALRDDRDDPRGLVGHPPAPRFRHRRAADL